MLRHPPLPAPLLGRSVAAGSAVPTILQSVPPTFCTGPPRSPPSVHRHRSPAGCTSLVPPGGLSIPAESFLDGLRSPAPDPPSSPPTLPGRGSAVPWPHRGRPLVRPMRALNQPSRLKRDWLSPSKPPLAAGLL